MLTFHERLAKKEWNNDNTIELTLGDLDFQARLAEAVAFDTTKKWLEQLVYRFQLFAKPVPDPCPERTINEQAEIIESIRNANIRHARKVCTKYFRNSYDRWEIAMKHRRYVSQELKIISR